MFDHAVQLMKMPESELGDWLNATMKKYGVSQRELARRTGISQAQISKIASGGSGSKGESLVLIADALAGPDATEEDREALRREALAHSVGIEYPTRELQRSVLMERWGGRYDGLAESEELIAAAESHLDLLMDLREAQKRAAIGGKPQE